MSAILAVRCSISIERPWKVVMMKVDEKQSFGSFIRTKRLSTDTTLRGMAQILDISPVYMSNIETDRNPAPKADILENLAKALKLDKHEREIMYDLAAESKTYAAIPGDLPEYISANEYARIALRVAKDVDATDTEWIEFIEKLKKRSGQEDI